MHWEPLLTYSVTCRKDFPGYEAYKHHMKEMHSSTIVTATSTSTSNAIITSTSTSVGPSAVKMEVESDARLEEQMEKEDQSDIMMEGKHDPNDADFKYRTILLMLS